MQQDASFWDGIARRYAARPVRDPAAYEATLTRVRAHLEPTGTVWELGCGTGTTALRLAGAAGRITGTDLSSEMIAIAREKLAGQDGASVDFRQGTDADLPADASLDAVMAFNLLHLLPDRARSLANIQGALKPGGLFISKTPCLGGWLILRPIVFALRLIGKAPPVQFLKPDPLQAEIAAAGFTILESGDYPARPPSRFIVARKG
jgi:SAM-dependent methyltransferase